MPNSTLRLGVSMRVVQAEGYKEPRDALAQDWTRFLSKALPNEAAWLPVPNLGAEHATDYCEKWGINALILTGGEDFGVAPLRDETELALLNWAKERNIPVLGICRGMQLMCIQAGGDLKPVAGHTRTRHTINGIISGETNSYHNNSLTNCPKDFDILAKSEDGEIEAIRHQTLNWEGWMWHPEREHSPSTYDIERLLRLFQ